MKIEFRIDGQTVAKMEQDVPENRDEAGLIAQRYMKQFKAIKSAHIIDDTTERVISRRTVWQSRN